MTQAKAQDEAAAGQPDRLVSEQIIRLNDVADWLPRRAPGRKVSQVTLWRWATKGVRGVDGRRVRLETIKLGGRRYTSVEAVERFAAALDGRAWRRRRAKHTAGRRRSEAAAARDLRQAEEVLAEAGFYDDDDDPAEDAAGV